uniref:Signal recognition particle 14 kDa protein n=1 Tax=Neovison vison TaxID=452646 RepID=A0A8C7AQ22_NEOVI
MALPETKQFGTQLTRLSKKCQLSGSVFITQKKYDGRTKPIPRKGSVEGFEPLDKCLFRAPDGKEKISTMVRDIFIKECPSRGKNCSKKQASLKQKSGRGWHRNGKMI